MSFNLRYGTASDGNNSWSNRRAAAIRIVQGYGPDLVGLQEAMGFQVEEMLESLPDFASIGVCRDDGAGAGESCTILYGRDITPLDSGTFWFSETPSEPGSRHPECYHPRICTWGRFRHAEDDAEFRAFNLHLDNESVAAREFSMDLLLNFVAGEPSIPSFVTGDFNAGESDGCMQKLRAPGFRDTFRALHPDEQDAATYHGFGSEPDGGKIDGIWVDRSWSILSAEILRQRYGATWPSDHYPVAAEIFLAGAGL